MKSGEFGVATKKSPSGGSFKANDRALPGTAVSTHQRVVARFVAADRLLVPDRSATGVRGKSLNSDES